jgi:hypothetical protein
VHGRIGHSGGGLLGDAAWGDGVVRGDLHQRWEGDACCVLDR